MINYQTIENAANMLDVPVDLLETFVNLCYSSENQEIYYLRNYQKFTTDLEGEYDKLF